MSLIDSVVVQLKKLTPTSLESIQTIVEAAVTSGDPERYLKRMAIAQASKVAAKKTAEKVLAATKKK
jgi:hypothetical protein